MTDLIKWSIEGSFWRFLGFIMILGMFLNAICFIWNRFWRHWNIRKHGYPNPFGNFDADGDFKQEKE